MANFARVLIRQAAAAVGTATIATKALHLPETDSLLPQSSIDKVSCYMMISLQPRFMEDFIMDKLLALRWFVETVDTKGFSAAARSLGVATSSVTRLMDALEQELGTTLLNRSTRQVTVTEAGSLYYIKARQILDEVKAADAQIHDQGEEPAGPLRVTAPAAFGRAYLAPYLAAFLARYPKVDLELELTDTLVDLFADRIDVAIRLGSPGIQDELICRSIGHFQRFVVASPAYLARNKSPEQPEDLARHDCLPFNFSNAPQAWLFTRDGETSRVIIKGRLRSNDAEVLHKAALADGGITLLADWLVQADIESGRLIRLFPHHEVNPNQASTAISALYLPNRRGSRRVNAFIEFCETRLAGLRPC
ncbi:LysR family transcriptional regulator [Pseudomonas asuensis]|uniref:LysR family transcriptional regulator n=2 Tax=Pseudomonas asuensis TaxID=1825787 RepID=A0ABQ2GXH6_9PSED|nr:LysR family transcriptional regulator [Pseudomonas asuensis]